MTALTVRFRGAPPYGVEVVDVAPLPGVRVDRRVVGRAVRQRETSIELALDPGLYQVRLTAGEGDELRWIKVSGPGIVVDTTPVTGPSRTRRGGQDAPVPPFPRHVGVLLHRGASIEPGFLARWGFRQAGDGDDRRPAALNGLVLEHAEALEPFRSEPLGALRKHRAVAAAGPLFRGGTAFSAAREYLNVWFRAGATRAEQQRLMAQLEPTRITPRPVPRSFRVDFDVTMGVGIYQIVNGLAADRRVRAVEPGFANRPVFHMPTPTDTLWPLLWDREILDLPAAWEIAGADADIGVGVIDDGFESAVGHPDLMLSSSVDPGTNADTHGLFCMGLIASKRDGVGVVGAAPDSVMSGFAYPSSGSLESALTTFASGLDVVCMSLGPGSGGVTTADEDAIRNLTRTGRGGRGLPQFFSAGNDSAAVDDKTSFGDSNYGFATTGVSQANAKLSNGNHGTQVDWCAPSNVWTTGVPAGVDAAPAESPWMFTVLEKHPSLDNTFKFDRPEMLVDNRTYLIEPVADALPWKVTAYAAPWTTVAPPTWSSAVAPFVDASSGTATTVIAGAVKLGTVSQVVSVTSLEITWTHDPGTGENVFVNAMGLPIPLEFASAPGSTTLTPPLPQPMAVTSTHDLASAPTDTIFVNADVIQYVQHAALFGDSSAANALASGVGALVLRANPDLTFRELEEILKATATTVVPGVTAAHPMWQGQPAPTAAQLLTANEEAFGDGQLNALAAVTLAREYVAERANLHIRDHLGDQGDAPTAPMSPSPDIWVQSSAVVPVIGNNVAGPHVSPVAGGTNFVCVRIHNRGSRASTKARLILRVANGKLAPFNWPSAWPERDILTNPKVLHIDLAVELPSIAPHGVHIACVPWIADDMLPDADEPYLLAEITPQDGALAHPEVYRNTNLAIRPISFVPPANAPPPVVWHDGSGDPLGFSTPPDAAFTVHVHVDHGVIIKTARFEAHGRDRLTGQMQTRSPTSENWDSATDTYQLTFDVPEDWAEMVLEAEIVDDDDRRAPSDQRFHRMAVRLPLQLTLLLDRSGSMGASAGSITKWAAARRAAVLFHSIYDEFKAPGDVFKAIGFHETGGSFTTTGTTLAALPAAGPTGATPLGNAILHGAADGTPGGFGYGTSGDRVLVLLTDGKHNRGPSLDDIRADLPANPVSVTANALQGIRIHACAFGAPGTIDTDALEGLVHGGDDPALRSFAGRLQSSENLANADDAGALTEMFLSVLSDVIGVEMIGPLDAANNTFVVEPGVDKFMFVAPAGPATLTLTGPGLQTTATVEGCLQITVTGNTAGNWTLNGTPTTDCFVLVDLQLTSKLTVEPTLAGGFDCAVRLLFAGQPITDARCELRARGPGESIGEAILNTRVRLNPRSTSKLSKRRRLVEGAVNRRHRALRIANNLHLLQPTGAGRFATNLDGPLRTGTWSFELKVTGRTPSGAPFERLVRASRVIAARPDANTSVIEWSTLANGDQQVVLTPKDARGERLGPGLDLKTFAKDITHPLVDRGDGTYAAVLPTRQSLTLSRQMGARLIPPPPLRLFAVKVTVVRLHIKASHDGRAAGEWVFVSRAMIGRRRKSARVPQRGVLSMAPNSTSRPNTVVLDDRVMEGEALALMLGAFELDGRARWTTRLVPSGAGVTRVGASTLRLLGDPRQWAGAHVVGEPGWQVELHVEIDGQAVNPRRTQPRTA